MPLVPRLPLILMMMWAAPSLAQPVCRDTPEGRICTVRQPLVNGADVTVEQQRALGLVTVNTPGGACSGTLLDRFWLLTARHCVTTDGNIGTALLAPGQIRITAAWAAGRTATATLVHDLSPNRPIPGRDIVLVAFGNSELGDTPRQPLLRRALRTTDTVTQFGRGLNRFATGVVGGSPPATMAGGSGPYRSGNFTPSLIAGAGYTLAMNAANQVGHGGDSGGPTWLIENGVLVGVAGVQSSCTPTGYVPGAPTQTWPWATGISACQYVSVEPLVAEIERALAFRELVPLPGWSPGPPCQTGAACVVPAIIPYLVDP